MQSILTKEFNSTNSNIFPLSQVQKSAWFLYKLSTQGYADKLALGVRIPSEVDINRLKNAFNILVERHPSLRSAYFQHDKQFVQQVQDKNSAKFEVVDAAGWSEEELQENLHKSIQLPFNLEAGFVMRMSLFHISPSNYVLLLTVHYIACDWKSLLIFKNELLELYQEKNIIDLPLLTQSYQDYVEAEIKLFDSSRLQQLQNYWGKQLVGELPLLNLPMSQSRTVVRSYNGASEVLKIAPELKDKLQVLATYKNITLPVLLLTAFQVLIYRYTGEEDIIVGLLTELRKSDLAGVVGNFTNILPLRVAISDNQTFWELCYQVKEVWENAIAYQDYPFPSLVRQLQPDFNPAHPPICQVGFAWEDLNNLNNLKNLSQIEYFELPQQRVEFDVSLDISALENSLTCALKYNTDLFDASTITFMVEHFQNLLQAITFDLDSSISQLSLLSAKEKQQLLFDWNNTQVEYDLSCCLHQLFEIQVEKTPDAVAVKFADKHLTYRELNNRANQLAHYLQSLGVQPETLVGICIQRCLEMVVGLLGILKAGGAYVPIDPGYPSERITYMLEDSQVSILLTQSNLIVSLPTQANHTICLDSDWDKISQNSQNNYTNPKSGVKPENLAYVIYTSGSTGKPKGAMNTHQGICNRLLWMQDAYQLTAEDKILQKTPFSFDVSVWEFFWTLITGARLVVAEPGGHRDSTYLFNTIIEEGITTLHFVPSMLQVFLETKELEKCQSLKRVICSGEALPLDLQKRFFARLGCELHNLYGPTEAAIDVTFWQCQPNTNLKSVPIGRPIANTQIYILDKHLQPVPAGVVGELYIGGVGVGRGYLNKVELTGDRFISNPFAFGKMYKTGDLARYLPDGKIDYIGRIDNQVKIRGFRIELGEIENAISQYNSVREAVVVAPSDRLNNKQLIAYIVPHQEELTSKELRDFLKEKLPEFMIPSAFVILDALPLTPSGKVDRRALPKPELSVFSRHESFVSPRNNLEKQLAEIWSEILNISEISVKDNFFEIGGNSLSAVYLMSAIAEKFNRELPLAILFANSTIEELAEILQNSNQVFANSPLVPIQPKGKKQPFFCIHPAGGHVLCYFNLSRYLGNDQPFYGLQAQGFYGDEEPLTTVEEMASLYVKTIRTFKPEGPYQIGGWSFGGVVAYEVAQQLQRQGQEVSLLAILDSYVPILLDKAKPIDNTYLVGVLSRVFGGMFGQDNLVSPQEIEHLTIEEKLDYIIDKARQAKIFPPGVERQNNRRILDVLVGTLKATYSYQRQPYPGKVTIFRAQEKHIMAPDPTMVWVELFSVLAANDIEIYKVPGHHYSFVLEPHVKVLAERLSDRLCK
ncbi:MAG: amino acid adenylation domain-containing protein [Heteroscytonema crispum UTEX LB 1556]